MTTTTLGIAAQIGATNWITEGTAVKGWFTCEITGKKFRGTDAEEQFARQACLMAEYEAKRDVDQAHDAHLESQEDAALVPVHKLDMERLTEEQEERLLEEGFAGVSKRQWDLYTHSRDRMSGSLWDHLNNLQPTKDGKAPAIKLIAIKCECCGDERKIKVQDQFQVKRCIPCQLAHRNAIRAEKRKAKRAAAKAATPAE